MTMPEMQKAIANLRMVLASIRGKEGELRSAQRQFQRQLIRAPSNTIRGGNSLDATIGIMQEIQERLDDVESKQKQLEAIKKRTQDELQALQLTDRIEQAKNELKSIRIDPPVTPEGEMSRLDRIEELERFIEEASIRAGQAIAGDLDDEHRWP